MEQEGIIYDDQHKINNQLGKMNELRKRFIAKFGLLRYFNDSGCNLPYIDFLVSEYKINSKSPKWVDLGYIFLERGIELRFTIGWKIHTVGIEKNKVIIFVFVEIDNAFIVHIVTNKNSSAKDSINFYIKNKEDVQFFIDNLIEHRYEYKVIKKQ